MQKLFLRQSVESAGTGNPADDFEPYLLPFLLADKSRSRGFVLVLPGGGYCSRAPHEADPIALRFNELGFHAAVLHYRVAPYHFPAEQRDALRAIKLVRQHACEWGVDPEHIAILGFSAGGHLALSAGVLYNEVDAGEGDGADKFSSRPDALIGCYPVVNISKELGGSGSGMNLLGDNYARDCRKFDLETRVSADTPPTFLWHTADDNVVNVRNSLDFFAGLRKFDVSCEMHIFPRGVHGLGITVPEIAVWPELAAKFLRFTCKFPE